MSEHERRHADEVILAKLDGFRELFEERSNNMEQTLFRVEEQVKKTNGRVTVLELEGAETRGKAKLAGVIWGGMVSICVSVVAFFINKNMSA